MKVRIGVAIALALIAVMLPRPAVGQWQPGEDRQQFCDGWQGVCNRTCPGGGDCSAVCQTRRGDCARTGCFHFNIPRPRCDNNEEDLALWRARPGARVSPIEAGKR